MRAALAIACVLSIGGVTAPGCDSGPRARPQPKHTVREEPARVAPPAPAPVKRHASHDHGHGAHPHARHSHHHHPHPHPHLDGDRNHHHPF
ncbi:MAG: hypothetical protein H0T89_35155 [Deltaproteobacteria bacterium]|nr:hypothetical protein [Deltaproteobacteria bacterium]